MSFTELIEELHKLSPEEREMVRRELEGLEEPAFEATPEMLAAIEEGERSLRETRRRRRRCRRPFRAR